MIKDQMLIQEADGKQRTTPYKRRKTSILKRTRAASEVGEPRGAIRLNEVGGVPQEVVQIPELLFEAVEVACGQLLHKIKISGSTS